MRRSGLRASEGRPLAVCGCPATGVSQRQDVSSRRLATLLAASPGPSRPGGCPSNDDAFPGHGMTPRPGALGPVGTRSHSRGPVSCLPLPLLISSRCSRRRRRSPHSGDRVPAGTPSRCHRRASCLTQKRVLCLSAGLRMQPVAAARLRRGSGHTRWPEPQTLTHSCSLAEERPTLWAKATGNRLRVPGPSLR